MAFTAQEKARVLHHLGYPSFASLSNGIQLGYPAASQPLFLVEQSFLRLTAGGEEAVRADLCECEETEQQLSTARGRMKVCNVGEVKMNPLETAQLRRELHYWRTKLADDLGCSFNPHSNAGMGDGSIVNSKVVG